MTSRPLFARVAEIDGDLGAHAPGRVTERLLRGDRREGRWGVEERTTRRGQDERGDTGHRFANEALPDRRVLRVDRAEPGKRARVRVTRVGLSAGTGEGASEGHHQVAARHERLLVRGRDDLPGTERGEDRAQADDPAGPDDHEVHVVPHRQGLEGVRATDPFRACRQVQPGQSGVVAQRHRPRPKPRDLVGEDRGVRAGGQRHDLEGVGMCSEDVDRLAPDRTGRAEQCDPASRALRRGRRGHTGSRPAPRRGTNRLGRGCPRGPG